MTRFACKTARRFRIISAAAILQTLLVAAPLSAQTPGSASVSEVILNLFDIRLDATPIPVPGQERVVVHAPHFTLREPTGGSPSLEPLLFVRSIIAQLSTFPLGSSSGGFTYTFDPALGTFARGSQSFGPAFAERAVTLGRRRLNVGANFQRVSFDTFEGRDLDAGELIFFVEHQPVGSFVEGDLVRTALTLDISQQTLAPFANYGVTDRLDVGVAVPIVRLSVDARREASIVRLATQGRPEIHRFPDGSDREVRQQSASAVGIGDVVIRGKYNFVKQARGGLAAVVDVRLPTGNEADLLGTGATQGKLLFVGSGVAGRFSPHVNVGYTLSGESAGSSSLLIGMPDELNYAFGLEFVVSSRITAIGDIVGRSLREFGRMAPETREHSYRMMDAPDGPVSSVALTQLRLQERANLNLVLGTTGVKFNVAGNLLISASVLFPMTEAGLRAGISPAIGIDYAF